MTRSQIEYILSLEKLKSFSKAAEECHVTQSTLSAMVAKFEQQTGVVLFNRKTKPITVTPKGEQVIRQLKSINREFQLLDEGINQVKGVESGQVSIAAIPTVAPYLFPLILDELSLNYPQVNFSIHEITTERVVEEILAGDIDIGIVSTPLEHKDLVEYPLYQEDFLLYDCGNTLDSDFCSVSDIDLDRLWLLEEGHCLRNQVGKICELRQQQKINGNLTYSCGSIFTLIEMVKLNRGVTLLPRLAIANNPQIKIERLYPIMEPVPTREIGLVTHKNFLKTRMLRNISSKIVDAVKESLPVDLATAEMVKPF
ncbi:MAG: LysR substrate-binding domain-containing protein [Bacteroidota bacterium]